MAYVTYMGGFSLTAGGRAGVGVAYSTLVAVGKGCIEELASADVYGTDIVDTPLSAVRLSPDS